VWEQARSRRRARNPVVAGGRPGSVPGPPEKNRARRGSLALPSTHHRIEPGCYSAPPSSNPDGSQPTRCGPKGAGSLRDSPPASSRTERSADPGSRAGCGACFPVPCGEGQGGGAGAPLSRSWLRSPLPGGERSSAARVRGRAVSGEGCHPSPAPKGATSPSGRGETAPDLHRLSLTPPPPAPPHRKAGVPDLRQTKDKSRASPRLVGEEGCRARPLRGREAAPTKKPLRMPEGPVMTSCGTAQLTAKSAKVIVALFARIANLIFAAAPVPSGS